MSDEQLQQELEELFKIAEAQGLTPAEYLRQEAQKLKDENGTTG